MELTLHPNVKQTETKTENKQTPKTENKQTLSDKQPGYHWFILCLSVKFI